MTRSISLYADKTTKKFFCDIFGAGNVTFNNINTWANNWKRNADIPAHRLKPQIFDSTEYQKINRKLTKQLHWALWNIEVDWCNERQDRYMTVVFYHQEDLLIYALSA